MNQIPGRNLQYHEIIYPDGRFEIVETRNRDKAWICSTVSQPIVP